MKSAAVANEYTFGREMLLVWIHALAWLGIAIGHFVCFYSQEGFTC